ncbi:MAG: class I SAM-dependent methyltransferase [Candidatus Freyarchaeum deiterrae]
MVAKNPYEKFAEVFDSFVPGEFHKDYYRFIIKVLKKLRFKPKSILDLACGTGRLTKLFLDAGYEVEGLDSSQSMLNIARGRGLKVHHGNMISFELGKKYDLVICVFDSLNYVLKQSDLQKCFKSVSRHLNRDGLFIFDMNSDYKINEVLPTYKNDYHRIGDTELIWLNSHHRNTWIGELILFERKEDGLYQRFYEKHVERGYTLAAIEKLLKKVQFGILVKFSDFKFNEIVKDSKRWFFVSKKEKIGNASAL